MLPNEMQNQERVNAAQTAKIDYLERKVAKVDDLERQLTEMRTVLAAIQSEDQFVAQR
ncbi:MAG: hypothetical protein ACLPQI_00315 [Steroidobacteraceae bacterium]